ncbi:coiled-coil domain-containing protein 61 isoform X2 [Meleagris gallopavo]|uniref:coiled-coil domain-containing protein 61 isoform X2 n=1 Tax=Meleagris gallopavo TaxID=9103 RepID=UPI000938B203|nr:coiled-coil domain-containing protein 61 isoform X2 [Meleagris gallopavo]
MEEPRCLQTNCFFRGKEHSVQLSVSQAVLEVEVEERRSTKLWRGRFDAASVEDLTRKTGNFKQFGIFCSMLEAALMKSSEAVSLELLTYGDLEALRCCKAGLATRVPPPTSPLSSKRYLILVYCVEFDRIHYPLPLPYFGEADVAVLRHLVQEQQDELAHLRDELRRAQQEVWRLEDERLRDKAWHQQEQQRMTKELAQVKAAEKMLQAHVNTLTAELAACRKGHSTSATAPGPPRYRHRSNSRDGRSSSQGRLPPRSPSPAGEGHGDVGTFLGPPPNVLPPLPFPLGSRPPRFNPTAFVRAREQRRQEAELRRQKLPRGTVSNGDDCRRRCRHSSSVLGAPIRSGSALKASIKPCFAPAESFQSQRSALSSGSEADKCPQRRRGLGGPSTRSPLSASSCNSSSVAPHLDRGRKQQGKENLGTEPSATLSEIDARLQALQAYISTLGTHM